MTNTSSYTYRTKTCPWCQHGVQLRADGKLCRHDPITGFTVSEDALVICVGSKATPRLRRVEQTAARSYRHAIEQLAGELAAKAAQVAATYIGTVGGRPK